MAAALSGHPVTTTTSHEITFVKRNAWRTHLDINLDLRWTESLVAVRNRSVPFYGGGKVNDSRQLEALLDQARPDGQDR